MVIQSYQIILAVQILGWFLLKWAGFGELLGWKSSTRSGNTGLWCHLGQGLSRVDPVLFQTGETSPESARKVKYNLCPQTVKRSWVLD